MYPHQPTIFFYSRAKFPKMDMEMLSYSSQRCFL